MSLSVAGEDNIKLYIRELKCEGVDLVELAQDKVLWRAYVN